MKKIILALLVVSSLKTYAQTNNSDCQGLDAQQQKEAAALEAKYFDYAPDPKHYGVAACNDHVPRDFCRLHHSQCANNCDCYKNYLNESRTLESKYSVKQQLCAERVRKQQEIADARLKDKSAKTSNDANIDAKSYAGEAILYKAGDNALQVKRTFRLYDMNSNTGELTVDYTNNSGNKLDVCVFFKVYQKSFSSGLYSGWVNVFNAWSGVEFVATNNGQAGSGYMNDCTGSYVIYYRISGSNLKFPTAAQITQRVR